MYGRGQCCRIFHALRQRGVMVCASTPPNHCMLSHARLQKSLPSAVAFASTPFFIFFSYLIHMQQRNTAERRGTPIVRRAPRPPSFASSRMPTPSCYCANSTKIIRFDLQYVHIQKLCASCVSHCLQCLQLAHTPNMQLEIASALPETKKKKQTHSK